MCVSFPSAKFVFLHNVHAGTIERLPIQKKGHQYVIVQTAIWLAGGVAVPLCASHPAPELAYVIRDSGACLVLTDMLAPTNDAATPPTKLSATGSAGGRGEGEEGVVDEAPRRNVHPIVAAAAECQVELERTDGESPPPMPTSGRLLNSRRAGLPASFEAPAPESRCLIIYTSGTTGPPKGAVLLHSNLAAQVQTMVQPWGWTARDRLLHMLPLHHLHGVLNCLAVPLTVGATVEFLQEGFNPSTVWQRLIGDNSNPTAASTGTTTAVKSADANSDPPAPAPPPPITVLMAVPTIYHRMLEFHDSPTTARVQKEEMAAAAKQLRLAVSGSAALPPPTFNRWEALAGTTLLERWVVARASFKGVF